MGFFKKKKAVSVKEKKIMTPEVQIMMLGARRTGKTCMLASMYNSFSDVVAGTNLVMSKKGGKAIDTSLNKMKSIFNTNHMVNDVVSNDATDYKQTSGFDIIDFLLTIAGKKNITPKVIRFWDCSGECISNGTNEEEIGAKVEMSDVVIIAIDTVLLMEENGKYNSMNAVGTVTEFIINYMNPDEIVNNKKMVLFVPMKCEKYFHQNNEKESIFYKKRMQAIADRIQEEYSKLIHFLTAPNNKKFFTVGILPVITLGGIEFDEFTSDNQKDILTDAIKYRYCEPNKFDPQYCDQPLIYSLLFVQKKIRDNYYRKAYDANNGKKKLTATITEWFQDKRNIAKDTDYLIEMNKVIEHLKSVDYPGFKMIQDPESIEIKLQIDKKG